MKTKTPRTFDDGLEWLRKIRREMAAEANYDPHLMGQRLREMEEKYRHRLVRTRKVLEPVRKR